jgi:hypothetical protein
MYDGNGRRDGNLMGLRLKGKDALPVSLSLRPQSGVKPLTFRPPSLPPSLALPLPPSFLSLPVAPFSFHPRHVPKQPAFLRPPWEGGREEGREGRRVSLHAAASACACAREQLPSAKKSGFVRGRRRRREGWVPGWARRWGGWQIRVWWGRRLLGRPTEGPRGVHVHGPRRSR